MFQRTVGLRVAKEDKHTNLIRGRAMKAQALAEASITDPAVSYFEINTCGVVKIFSRPSLFP